MPLEQMEERCEDPLTFPLTPQDIKVQDKSMGLGRSLQHVKNNMDEFYRFPYPCWHTRDQKSVANQWLKKGTLKAQLRTASGAYATWETRQRR